LAHSDKGREADSLDVAQRVLTGQWACEGFFGRLKTALFYPRDWQATNIEQFIQIVDTYIHWYNEKRVKISLGSLSPLEYRASLGLTA